ncbi:hypothetical protein B566_EDAN007927 [Ephemera danica]|nr:hypothetical protein B566_EDAN007927 [Ephemera danica]
MGTPDGFKPKRMGDKWKRIIQPDGDSDSSLDCWDDNMNGSSGNSAQNQSLRLPPRNMYRNVRDPREMEGNDDPRDPRPGPSNSGSPDLVRSAGPSNSPDVMSMQRNSGQQHSHPLNLAPSLSGLNMRGGGPLSSHAFPPPSSTAATATMSASPQVSSTSSNPSTPGSPATRNVGALLSQYSASRQRRVHFQDAASFENRLQRMRQRITNHRQHLLRGEQYRTVGLKDSSGLRNSSRTPTSPVLSSSIASLRSMMRCGNNPDWLKLSGHNIQHRTIRWSVAQAGPSTADFSGEWRMDTGAGPSALQDSATNLSAPSTSTSGTSGSNSAPNNMETVTRNILEQPELQAERDENTDEAMVQDPIQEAATVPEAEPTADNIEEAQADAPAAAINDQVVNEEETIPPPINPLSELALNSSILSMLECPVCLEHMGPPIHQCRRGHLVCNSCRGQLLTCPTCRSRFTDLRNLALERIAELLHFPCKNEECGQSFKLRSKEEHELNCPWRTYTCMAQNCQWQGLHQSLLTHVQEQHSELLLNGDSHRLEMPFDMPFSRNYVISAWGQLFRLNMQRGPGNGVVFSVVQYLGPVSRAADYTFTLTLEQSGTLTRSIVYTRTMHPDNIRPSQIYQAGDAFAMNPEQAKHFSMDLRKVYVHAKLEKVPSST